jgi:hypothetical protein
MLQSGTRGRRWPLALAVGPLVKLTALPVAAAALVALWRRGERRLALAGAAAAALVAPVQVLRGWSRVGTLELNRALPPLEEGLFSRLAGIARSAYVVVKSAFWTGGWSFFRPPRLLLAAAAVLLLAAALAVRRRRRAFPPEHLVGLAVVLSGSLVVVLASRRYWGDWGGVGGWYLWSWSPWLAFAAADAFTVAPRRRALLLAALCALTLAANALYVRAALRLYG